MRKFTYQPMDSGHFFASSIAEWRAGTDLEKLIKAMKAGGLNFSLFYVPLPEDSAYKIANFMPQTGGVIHLGTYKVKA